MLFIFETMLVVLCQSIHLASGHRCVLGLVSECNLVLENYKDIIKTTAKQVKTQIQKGANPGKTARNVYEETCD